MPLHDWSELPGGEGVHLLWMSELLRHVKANLPEGFRAYLGTGPAVAVGAPPLRPDVGVRTVSRSDATRPGVASSAPGNSEPDVEVAVAALDPAPALFVERDSRLVAAVELVSPRNKDRPIARATYLSRYASYLIEGVHLLLVLPGMNRFTVTLGDRQQCVLVRKRLPEEAPGPAAYGVGGEKLPEPQLAAAAG